jgi:hypothetical protein
VELVGMQKGSCIDYMGAAQFGVECRDTLRCEVEHHALNSSTFPAVEVDFLTISKFISGTP